ncbi:MAG: hypothetical protein EPN43_13675 [Jatrophihabitans sp.]|nr:MAG: hypothetical protein EPN43_13675 [Jatrophihabitans sp.]
MPLSPAYAPARIADLRAAALIVAVTTLAGLVLGLVWGWWSPPGPAALVVGGGAFQPDETEAFVAADGRYAVLAVGAGLCCALVVWFARLARGVTAQVAVGVGSMGSAVAMAVAGRWTGGGSTAGAVGTVVPRLPVSVHMHGLLFVQAAVAVLVYGMCASFARADDLGRPEPASVGRERHLHDAGGDGDAAGGLEQPQFPPQ